MAKVLEALERAKQERQKKIDAERAAGGQVLDPAEGETSSDILSPVGSSPTRPAPSEEPSPAALVAMAGELRHPRPDGRAAIVHTQIDERVISAHDVESPITEQLRQIRTNLETVLAEYRSRSLVVTSPVPGDGKSLVTANLATVLADNPEHRVLLVDSDMRKPDVYRLFGVRQTPGLSEYLRERATLDQVVHTTALPNLQVIPAGRSPHKPTVLLSSERMVQMISELQRQYHWILFDTPPLLPVTDASVIARECVGLVLVLRMGQTHRKTIERAQDLLAEMRLPVLGCILNDFVDASPENQYYYKYYRRAKNDESLVKR